MKYYSFTDIMSSHDISKWELRQKVRTGEIIALKQYTSPSRTTYKYIIPATELTKLISRRVSLPKASEASQPGYYEARWDAERVRKEKLQGEREREPRRVNYQEYMQSSAWRQVRNEALKRDGYVCSMCGTGKNLRVHHISYERLGKEGELDDVVTLCEGCHAKVHAVDLARKEQTARPSVITWRFNPETYRTEVTR